LLLVFFGLLPMADQVMIFIRTWYFMHGIHGYHQEKRGLRAGRRQMTVAAGFASG
jgi:hypothetical protein